MTEKLTAGRFKKLVELEMAIVSVPLASVIDSPLSISFVLKR